MDFSVECSEASTTLLCLRAEAFNTLSVEDGSSQRRWRNKRRFHLCNIDKGRRFVWLVHEDFFYLAFDLQTRHLPRSSIEETEPNFSTTTLVSLSQPSSPSQWSFARVLCWSSAWNTVSYLILHQWWLTSSCLTGQRKQHRKEVNDSLKKAEVQRDRYYATIHKVGLHGDKIPGKIKSSLMSRHPWMFQNVSQSLPKTSVHTQRSSCLRQAL